MSHVDLLGKNFLAEGIANAKSSRQGCAWQVEEKIMRPTPMFIAALSIIARM